ncbi:glutathione S-transferase family protein [Hirsutella rhossiliensis]|uniref:Glutathione S-transferase family protein n=1 Tax=Hirsutella rhossiliensis TaxID=111463 RepID=A0A9P8MQ78_9HYPO|nr:glutathione S-transferase family protein [Hirsutella rhossiliensis]KAH0960268.1 glutathione S-transferase family protein [Hirsutella rhossiliensis]
MSSQAKAGDDAPYELIYWPGLPGRGELVRVLFEEAGVPYTDSAKGARDDAVSAVLGYISPDNEGDANNPPVFAPPILKHGSLVLHQSSNILLYLAPRLGLAPAPGDPGLLHLNQIVLTILDGLVSEVHETHHPVAVSAVYEDQKPEAKRRSRAFRDERLPKYLGYLQRLLDAKTSGQGPWLYRDQLTYADLVLFQSVDGTLYAFPKTMDKLKRSGKYAGVFELYDAVKQRPNIKAYLASDRRAAYSGGIWRCYPELEED